MKLAYIILVHKNPTQVSKLLNQIKEDWNDVFVHIDSKAVFSKDEILDNVDFESVYFTENRHSVDWGGYKMIEATFELFDLVNATQKSKGEKYDRIVLLSGQDFPVVSNQKIYEYFSIHANQQVMTVCDIDKNIDRFRTSVYRRIVNLRLTGWIQSKNPLISLIGNILKNIPRIPPKNLKFYYGSQWFNITEEFMQYLLEQKRLKTRSFEFFKNSFIPDETMFQTLLMNSEFKDQLRSEDTRLIPWKDGNPHIFVKEDFDRLTKEGVELFARKFDINVDSEIIDMLSKQLNSITCA